MDEKEEAKKQYEESIEKIIGKALEPAEKEVMKQMFVNGFLRGCLYTSKKIRGAVKTWESEICPQEINQWILLKK